MLKLARLNNVSLKYSSASDKTKGARVQKIAIIRAFLNNKKILKY